VVVEEMEEELAEPATLAVANEAASNSIALTGAAGWRATDVEGSRPALVMLWHLVASKSACGRVRLGPGKGSERVRQRDARPPLAAALR
jgi:hypothetical protein